MNSKQKSAVIPPLFFSLYMFVFLLTEFTVNERAQVLCGDEKVNLVYSIGIFCSGLGYLCFPLSRKLTDSDKINKAVTIVCATFFLCSTLIFVLVDSKVIFLISAFLSLLSFGYVGAMVHCYISVVLYGSPHTGKIVGFSAAAATLVQFAVQNLFDSQQTFIVTVVLAVIGITCISLKPPDVRIFETPLPYSKSPVKAPKIGILSAVAVGIMSIPVSLNDGILTFLHASGDINLSSYSRLFFAGGLIIAGMFADIKKRKYITLSTVSAMFISAVASLFLAKQELYFINTSLLYFYCGFYTVFMSATFIDIAPQTGNPAFWAGLGRVIRCFVTAVAVIPSVILFDRFGNIAVSILSCLFCIVTMLICAVGGMLTSTQKEIIEEEPQPIDQLSKFSQNHNLTPRETEVLSMLFNGTESTQEIADSLLISRRMVERYFSQIYEKTGSKSRIGLVMMFHNESK